MATVADVLAHPCPTCKMPADSACVNESGGVESGVHSTRIHRYQVVTEAEAHNREIEAMTTPEPDPVQPFGFRVQHQPESGPPGDPWHDPEGWRVRLPHQCDAWEIAPRNDYGVVPHAEAVAGLEAFITEAQEALAALREEKEFGRD